MITKEKLRAMVLESEENSKKFSIERIDEECEVAARRGETTANVYPLHKKLEIKRKGLYFKVRKGIVDPGSYSLCGTAAHVYKYLYDNGYEPYVRKYCDYDLFPGSYYTISVDW